MTERKRHREEVRSLPRHPEKTRLFLRHREETAGQRHDPDELSCRGKAIIQRVAAPTVTIQDLKSRCLTEKNSGFFSRFTPSE